MRGWYYRQKRSEKEIRGTKVGTRCGPCPEIGFATRFPEYFCARPSWLACAREGVQSGARNARDRCGNECTHRTRTVGRAAKDQTPTAIPTSDLICEGGHDSRHESTPTAADDATHRERICCKNFQSRGIRSKGSSEGQGHSCRSGLCQRYFRCRLPSASLLCHQSLDAGADRMPSLSRMNSICRSTSRNIAFFACWLWNVKSTACRANWKRSEIVRS